jgi:glyoxylase-like metal-dependent hydrolase (beta-lactamase superfamily II)
MDHMGGLVLNDEAYQRALLSPEQQAHPENLKPLKYPSVKPKTIDYSGMVAVAPGVVLIKAPGHTAGSQMVFVTRADGTEFLFLGDVAWQMDNVLQRRERARLVTTLMKEDRGNVLQQLEAIHAMHEKNPEVNLVPGHDPGIVSGLIAKGVLTAPTPDSAAAPAPSP